MSWYKADDCLLSPHHQCLESQATHAGPIHPADFVETRDTLSKGGKPENAPVEFSSAKRRSTTTILPGTYPLQEVRGKEPIFCGGEVYCLQIFNSHRPMLMLAGSAEV